MDDFVLDYDFVYRKHNRLYRFVVVVDGVYLVGGCRVYGVRRYDLARKINEQKKKIRSFYVLGYSSNYLFRNRRCGRNRP